MKMLKNNILSNNYRQMHSYCMYCRNNNASSYITIYTNKALGWKYCNTCTNKFIDDKMFIKCGIDDCTELLCKKSYYCKNHGFKYRILSHWRTSN